MKKYDLEKRLIRFSVNVIRLVSKFENSKAGKHLSGQIIRSATSAALNYGEAQSSESPKDFIHKMKITLKELRETIVALKIIQEANLSNDTRLLPTVLKENDELIAIFNKSISTAKRNSSPLIEEDCATYSAVG
jgi:four helix bundle protein